MIAYAPTETAAEGGKAKYMPDVNSAVASIPVREHVFVLTDANARTGKGGEGGGVPMVDIYSTKMANYCCCASQKTINSLF